MFIKAFLKILFLIIPEFSLICYYVGFIPALIITGIILIYSCWIGEFLALKKMQAIPLYAIPETDRLKLERSSALLYDNIRQTLKREPLPFHISIIPTDEINACSLGIRNIAITQGALRNLDVSVINALLAHEIGHTFFMDAVISRIWFADTLLLLFLLSLSQYILLAVIACIIGILGILGILHSFFSWMILSGLLKFIKSAGNAVCQLTLSFLQMLLCIINRHQEYKADRFTCQLGYGTQLKYFLERFADGNTDCSGISDILYNTHPASWKRIQRIEACYLPKAQKKGELS